MSKAFEELKEKAHKICHMFLAHSLFKSLDEMFDGEENVIGLPKEAEPVFTGLLLMELQSHLGNILEEMKDMMTDQLAKSVDWNNVLKNMDKKEEN